MSIEKYKDFLQSIERLASDYPSIYEGDNLISLSLYFWSWDEIVDGIGKREEWDISDNLFPFYGDWHDLFCLKIDDGSIISINDARGINFQWDDTASFKSSFSSKEIETPESTGIVSGQLDF